MSAAVYITDEAAYVSGVLRGVWIEVSSDEEEMLAKIEEMLDGSPVPGADEWTITAYDGVPSCLATLGELAAFAGLIEEVGEVCVGHCSPGDLAYAMVENWHSVEEASENTENFAGVFDDFRQYADEVAEERLSEAPQGFAARYFDYAAFARDLAYDMTVLDLPCGSVAVFYP